MADNAPPTPTHKPQSKPPPPPTNNHFLLRAILTLIFFILTPLLPSLFPDSLSHSWELLHIVFVGLAVSYGLFSRRYSSDHSSPSDSSDSSYVSTLLHASSVFDDADPDSPPPTTPDDDSATKVQTWSSQYFRNKPVIVLANKKDDDDDGGGDHRPLLLPVRSLNSRVSDRDSDSRVSGSNWDKVRYLSLRRPRFENSSSPPSGIALPSPIPWRSRSGKMTVDKIEEVEDPNSFKPPQSKGSPVNLFESQAKRSEDLVRRKSVYRSPPPPPPPPPPMPLYNRSSLMKSKGRMENRDPPWEDLSAAGGKARSKVDYSSTCVKSCRTVRSRSWDEEAEEEESNVVQDSDDPTRNWNEDAEEESYVVRDSDELTHNWNGDGGDDFLGEVVDTSEEEDDRFREVGGSEETREEGGGESCSGVDEEGPDVDKKADEFIAKFREQIRLQRIESIKKSTGQFSKGSVG